MAARLRRLHQNDPKTNATMAMMPKATPIPIPIRSSALRPVLVLLAGVELGEVDAWVLSVVLAPKDAEEVMDAGADAGELFEDEV
jgi:hypothetical protein